MHARATGQKDQARRAGVLALVGLLLGTILAVSTPAPPAGAAVVDPFTVVFDDTVWGDYLLVGNSQLECITSTTPDRFDVDDDSNTTETLGPLVDWQFYSECSTDAARDTVSGSTPNDHRFMVFTRTDTSSGIFNASDVTFTLPPGSNVRVARLYWHGNDVQASGAAGMGATNLDSADNVDSSPGSSPWPSCQAANTPLAFSSYGVNSGYIGQTILRQRLRAAYRAASAGARTQMKLRVGTGNSFQTITSAHENLSPTDGTSGHLYQQEADVTSLLQAAPRGTPVTITGANISTGIGLGCTGAWSLAIVFDYPNRDLTYAPDLRRVQIYDGFAEVSSTENFTITLPGFLASGGGTVEPRMGVVGYEGDQQIAGDAFALEGATLAEPRLSPGGTTGNFWASTIGEFTTSTVTDFTRNPNHRDTAGPDIKVVPISVAALSGASNGVDANFSTTGDRYTPGVFAFSALDAVVSGRVFEDTDDDGVNDVTEPGIAGVTVTLTGTDSVGTPVNRTTSTGSDGKYVFTALPAANGAGYTVTVSHPPPICRERCCSARPAAPTERSRTPPRSPGSATTSPAGDGLRLRRGRPGVERQHGHPRLSRPRWRCELRDGGQLDHRPAGK
ncbi:MAG: SdrD B-like domain-containing protein [Ilumatobacteraceae bacterium]